MEKLSKPILAAAISDFSALKHESAGMRIKNLLNVLVDEIRVMNDTCRPEDLTKNQGRIDAYLTLIDFLENGLRG